MFLPSTGYDKLQLIPFRYHSAAATVKDLATPDEWSTLSSMGALVPFRQGVLPKDMRVSTATPRPAVASRFLSSQTFKMFGNYDMYNRKTAVSSQGSSSSSAGAERVMPDPGGPVLTLRPKEYYSLIASENADRVTKWVSKATETGTSAIDPEQSVPPEEYPPEQKPVRGVLKRRVRETSKGMLLKSQAGSGEEKALYETKPALTIPLKPKPTPILHRTMAQKTSPNNKSPLKQATLEKFWSNAFAAVEKEKSKDSKFRPRESSPSANPRAATRSEENSPDAGVAKPSVPAQNDLTEVKKTTPIAALRADSHNVLEIFNALQPTLEAARSFPGTLELEAHIELITIAPPMPGSGSDEAVVTIDDWKEMFQSKQGNSLTPYWAWNKVSGSGADVDAMIDMIWSKKIPQRIFQETPAGQDVVFEYHCRHKDGSTFVISLDEAGHSSFHHTPYVLGCSTIHFPHRMWDMNITLTGEMNLQSYKEPALKKAIDDFIETVWFQPGNDLVIFCSEPKDKIFSVEKTLMKSTIRHKHRPINEGMSSELTFKTVEVRQFLTGRKPGHPRLIRGRIPVNKRQECVAAKMLWYEVSVVSEAIQKSFAANRELELGQQTQKWTAVDLLGDEIEVKDISYESSKVAQNIGDSGLGSMYRLAKIILDRMRVGEVVA